MCNDRIIRRFAGAFTLVSLGLGWWVHPAWLLFTAFVAAEPDSVELHGVVPTRADTRNAGRVRLSPAVTWRVVSSEFRTPIVCGATSRRPEGYRTSSRRA